MHTHKTKNDMFIIVIKTTTTTTTIFVVTHLQHPIEHPQDDVGADPDDRVGHGKVRPEVPGHLQLGRPGDGPCAQVAPEERSDRPPARPVLRIREEQNGTLHARMHVLNGASLIAGGKINTPDE